MNPNALTSSSQPSASQLSLLKNKGRSLLGKNFVEQSMATLDQLSQAQPAAQSTSFDQATGPLHDMSIDQVPKNLNIYISGEEGKLIDESQ